MGLIKAALGSAGGVLADQWKEYFYCESMPENVMVTKGQKRTGGRSSNTKGSDNIISNGSVIAVADGQCMMIVDQGKVAELCAEPGEFTYDTSTEPSIFSGDLGTSIVDSFKNMGKRFTFGGEPPKDQRVYYFNKKELIGNKYGTPSPVPFRVVDNNIGLDMDIAIRCFGEYSYRICDPLLFYTNVSGNVESEYRRETIDGQLKSELMTALQPAFAKISELGIRYSALPGHTMELADALNEVLSAKWRGLRGIEIVSFGVSSVKASEEDERMIKELQRNATFRNPTMAAAHMVGAQAAAMQSAAANEGAGPAMAFMGMNMAGQAGGMNAQNLFAMGQQQTPPQQQYQQPPQQQQPPASPPPAPTAEGWSCPACGHAGNSGKFCMECGKPKPEQAEGWSCACGAVNKGKFCMECGKPKPAGVPQYKCDKCGWEPEDKVSPPKFCPECGDVFDDGDIV
jgi:membrane protease subunit (stomatin/prohibitin family)